jgi:hypothetical protein
LELPLSSRIPLLELGQSVHKRPRKAGTIYTARFSSSQEEDNPKRSRDEIPDSLEEAAQYHPKSFGSPRVVIQYVASFNRDAYIKVPSSQSNTQESDISFDTSPVLPRLPISEAIVPDSQEDQDSSPQQPKVVTTQTSYIEDSTPNPAKRHTGSVQTSTKSSSQEVDTLSVSNEPWQGAQIVPPIESLPSQTVSGKSNVSESQEHAAAPIQDYVVSQLEGSLSSLIDPPQGLNNCARSSLSSSQGTHKYHDSGQAVYHSTPSHRHSFSPSPSSLNTRQGHRSSQGEVASRASEEVIILDAFSRQSPLQDLEAEESQIIPSIEQDYLLDQDFLTEPHQRSSLPVFPDTYEGDYPSRPQTPLDMTDQEETITQRIKRVRREAEERIRNERLEKEQTMAEEAMVAAGRTQDEEEESNSREQAARESDFEARMAAERQQLPAEPTVAQPIQANEAEADVAPLTISQTQELPDPNAQVESVDRLFFESVDDVGPLIREKSLESNISSTPDPRSSALPNLVSGPMEHFIALPVNASVRDVYIAEVANNKKDIQSLVIDRALDDTGIQRIDTMIRDLKLITDHQDLVETTPSQNALSDDLQARWAETASSKCLFLRNFLDALRWTSWKAF